MRNAAGVQVSGVGIYLGRGTHCIVQHRVGVIPSTAAKGYGLASLESKIAKGSLIVGEPDAWPSDGAGECGLEGHAAGRIGPYPEILLDYGPGFFQDEPGVC